MNRIILGSAILLLVCGALIGCGQEIIEVEQEEIVSINRPNTNIGAPLFEILPNVDADNEIVSNASNKLLVIDTSFLMEKENYINNVEEEAETTGIVKQTFGTANEIWLDVGENEERVIIVLKDDYRQLDAWIGTTKTFTGYFYFLEGNQVAIYKAIPKN